MLPHLSLPARLFPALCLIALLSCSAPPSPAPLMLKAFREGVDNSTLVIHHHNETLYSQLRATADDSIEGIKVRLWMPRIGSVQACTARMSDYLDTLGKELAAKPGASGIRSFSEGRGPELYQRLIAHRERLLAIDLLFAETFRGKQYFIPDSGCYKNEAAFMASFFGDATPGAAEMALAQFRNAIQVMCAELLSVCKENTQVSFDDFYTYSEIVSLSSSAVRPGEQIEVTAGVVSFSRYAQPQITINGAKTSRAEDGYFRCDLKAPAKPGRQFIHVRMDYRDLDGRRMSVERNVPYTVIGNDRNRKDSL